MAYNETLYNKEKTMFFKSKKPAPVITDEQQSAIIKAYLERIALSYKDQSISAERMIEMEQALLDLRDEPVVFGSEANLFVPVK